LSRPFSEIEQDALAQVEVLATDIDDTLTTGGRLSLAVIESLSALADRGIDVLLTTGRPAGILTGLVTFLPGLTRGIAENGSVVVFPTHKPARTMVQDVQDLKEKLKACEIEIKKRIPHAQTTDDLYARLVDFTFELSSLSGDDRRTIDQIATDHELTTMASTIHLHINQPGVNKGSTLVRILDDRSTCRSTGRVLTVGDSEVDVSLFDQELFPLSVGVANIEPYLDGMAHRPAFITREPGGRGFLEIAVALLQAKSQVD